jgi:hypothetical protein
MDGTVSLWLISSGDRAWRSKTRSSDRGRSDRQSMLFVFDLWAHPDVVRHAREIHAGWRTSRYRATVRGRSSAWTCFGDGSKRACPLNVLHVVRSSGRQGFSDCQSPQGCYHVCIAFDM